VKRPPPSQASEADKLAARVSAGVCRRAAPDLYFASAFLPRAKRDAAHALYAFCRLVPEAVASACEEAGAAALRHRPLNVAATPSHDEPHLGSCCSAEPFEHRLSLLRDRLDDLYAGRLELPAPAARSEEQHVLHAFSAAASRYQVPRQDLLDFARGCVAALAVRRYATWASLERDCPLAGGAAARAAACVLGVTHSGAGDYATKAGVAGRFTSILCRLKADVGQGRVYLPLEDLARFRYTERELTEGVVNENFRRLMRFEVERARRLFDEAAGGLCWVANDGSRLTAAVLLARSLALLDAIERQGYDVFNRPPALTRAQKLRALPAGWRLARRGPGGHAGSGSPSADTEPTAAAS
jgi:phytoene synthase